MKTLIKLVSACMLCASFVMQSFGQAAMTPIEEGGKMPNKLDKTLLPKKVTEVYIVEYPNATEEIWYGYPAFTSESDWYGYNPYAATDNNPEYYIVEFTKDKKRHKVIYSKDGQKVATHRRLVGKVPPSISNEIVKGPYKGWKISDETEEIVKEVGGDNLKVYKLTVEKGSEKHLLYYLPSGKLVIDKVTKI